LRTYVTAIRAVLVLAVLLAPAPGSAWEFSLFKQDFTLDVTNTLGYTYHFDNDNQYDDDDKYHQVLNVLDASLSHGDLRLGGRFDLNLFADTPADRLCGDSLSKPSWCGKRYENHFAAERLYLIVARPEFDVTMGDFYASLGRGMALNVVKLDELGQDTTIRGGKLVYHDHGMGLTFLAGETNPLDVDTATGYMAPWKAEPLLAGRLEYNILEKVIAGAHAVYVIHDNPNSSGVAVARTDHDLVGGAGIEVPNLLDGALAFVGEFDLQRTVEQGQVIRGPDREGEGINGVAAYASATAQIGDLTLLGEYKYYDDFELKAPGNDPPYALLYHHPPTLERITAEVHDNTSVSGGRLRADYNLGQLGPVELLVFANYGYFQDWAGGDYSIHDPHGGLELSWSEGEGKLQLESGLRRTFDEENGYVAYRDIHVEMDAEQPLASRHSLKLSWLLMQRALKDQLSELTWIEMDLALSYKWSPYLLLAVTFERQGDPRVVGDDPGNYYGGFVRYYITPSSYVTLRAGENRGGIKCYLGTCRYVPQFSGVDVQAVVRF